MYTKLIFLFAVIFCLAGCTFSGGGNSAREPQQKVTLQIDPDVLSDKSFSGFFELQEVIPLETCDLSVVNPDRITNLIFTPDNKIVISESDAPYIKVFERSGKYLYTINRSGRGPGEYGKEVQYVLYNEGRLIIRGFDGKMMYYDTKGNFLGQTPGRIVGTPFYTGEILPDGNFLVCKELMGLYSHKDPEAPYYSVWLVDSLGRVLKEMVQRPADSKRAVIYGFGTAFYKSEGKIYLTPLTDHTVYTYDPLDTVFRAVYEFEFKDVDFQKELLKDGASRPEEALDFFDSIYLLELNYAGEKYLHLYANCGSKNKSLSLIIENSTNRCFVFDRRATKEGSANETGRMVQNTQGLPVAICKYSDLTDESGNPADTPVAALLSGKVKIEEDMNPVICIYREK